MMMKWIPVVLTLFLAACSSDAKKTYYQLPTLNPSATVSAPVVTGGGLTNAGGLTPANQPRRLWISQVNVADFLNSSSSGLVYQTNDVQYVMAANNVWASPLDQQLQQTLQTYLSRDLPNWVVSSQQASDDNQEEISVNVTGFHGRHDGRAVISGSWTLTKDGQASQHYFSTVLKQDEDGYDALVRTLATGWKQQVDAMALQITGYVN